MAGASQSMGDAKGKASPTSKLGVRVDDRAGAPAASTERTAAMLVLASLGFLVVVRRMFRGALGD